MKEHTPRQPGRPIIERPRLLEQLESAETPTILLIAPAGYGKTTLLRQWAQRNRADAWVTAGTGSSDVAELAMGFSAALDPICSGLRDDVSQIVTALANPSRQVRELVDAFRVRLRQTSLETVVIDDYHLLASSTPAETFVYELFNGLDTRLLVSSRLRPSWATARAAIYGEVLEIGPDDLALTPGETADVLGDAPAATARDVLAKAKGWPAVIGLAALAKAPRRTPDKAVATTLFRFFAEELFTAAPATLQDDLLTMALLPSLSSELTDTQFGDRAASILGEAVVRGFATVSEHSYELHPLIREYLLARLAAEPDADARVGQAVALSLKLEAWDNARTLITHFGRVDLLDEFLKRAFMPLARMGRVGTLEEIRTFARSRSVEFTPAVTLIDAELALRDGLNKRAEALAVRVAENLDSSHPLAAHAWWVAGQGAQLAANFGAARNHFLNARSSAMGWADTRDALWGLLITSIFSEAFPADDVADQLHDRRNASPTDLLRATTAALVRRRYTTGFLAPLDTESAMHSLESVADPRVRTSFGFALAYEQLLRADYNQAERTAEITLEYASDFQLSWAAPHAEWVLAAARLGVRDFAQADRWLRRVERAAMKLDDPLISLNAAVLRARFLLALQRAEQAQEALMINDSRPVNPAMKAELAVTRALTSAILGDLKQAERAVEEAAAMTTAVEVRAHVAATYAVCRASDASAADAFSIAEQFDVWDPLVSTMRAHPPLLERLAQTERRRRRLQLLLRSCNDFDLARRASIPVGARPKTGRALLSPREREVFDLVHEGLTNKQIGELLFISPGTAKVHVHHILEKLGVRSRTEAAARYPLDAD